MVGQLGTSHSRKISLVVECKSAREAENQCPEPWDAVRRISEASSAGGGDAYASSPGRDQTRIDSHEGYGCSKHPFQGLQDLPTGRLGRKKTSVTTSDNYISSKDPVRSSECTSPLEKTSSKSHRVESIHAGCSAPSQGVVNYLRQFVGEGCSGGIQSEHP